MRKNKVFGTHPLLIISIIFFIISSTSCNRNFTSKSPQKNTSNLQIKSQKSSPISFEVKTPENPSFPPGRIILSFNSDIQDYKSKGETAITFKPQLKHSLHWKDKRNLEIKFLEYPKTTGTISFKIKKLPSSKEKLLRTNTFSINFPEFKIVNIFPYSLSENSFKIKIAFNYPVFIETLENSLKIYKDSTELPAKFSSVSGKNPAYLFLIEVNHPPFKNMKIHFDENFKSVNGLKLTSKRDRKINIQLIKRVLYINYHKTKETKDDFIVIFKAISQGKSPSILPKTLKGRVFVFPQVPFKISSSHNFIYIRGKFSPSRKYTFLFLSGIKDSEGAFLEKDQSFDVKIPQRKGELVFLYSGKYFGKNKGLKIPLSISAIKSLNVKAYYMPEENVLFWYSQGYGEDYSFTEYSKLIAEKDYKFKEQKTNVFFIDLNKLIGEPQSGIYMIYAKAISHSGRVLRDKIKITITDISIITKRSKNFLHIWTLDSSTLKEKKGVRVVVKDRKNFKLGDCFTNFNGYCKIPLKNDNSLPFIIFAKKGKEWSYMEIENSRIPLSSFNLRVDNIRYSKNYVFAVFLERDLIRPSEKLNFAVIARKAGKFSGISIPLRVKIRDPKSKVIKEFSAKTDLSGMAEFMFETNPLSPTGKYAIEIYVGNNLLYTEFFFVETFAPEKLLIDLSVKRKIKNDTIPISVKAVYLIGEPASGEKLKGKVTLKEFSPKCYGFGGYKFGELNFKKEKTFYIEEKTLDNEGKIEFEEKVDGSSFSKPIIVTINVEVTEGGSGRVTKKTKTVEYYRENYYIGLKSETSKIVEGKPYKISGIAIKEGCKLYRKLLTLTYDIYELDYYYSYFYSRRFNWERNIEKLPIETNKKVVSKNGKFEIVFYPENPYKSYLIEVKDETGKIKSQYIARGYWYSENKPENPQILKITTEKEECFEGDKVKAKVFLPFEGKILWSVELSSVYRSELKSAEGKISEFEFTCPKNVSNVFISALLIKKDRNYLIERAFGLKELKVKKKNFNLKLKIIYPETIKPQKKYNIKIIGKGKYKAIISIVDEGILNITGYSGVDLYSTILSPGKLSVQTSDTFGWIVKKFMTGGGMEGALAMSASRKLKKGGLKMLYGKEKGFSQPRFIKTVSLWSGILESDSRGIINYEFRVPEYQGRLKLMIIALTKDKISTYTKEITVKRDVFVNPTIPRFLYSGDSFTLPILLYNTTKKKRKVQVYLSGEIVKGDKTILLLPKEKKVLYFDGKAKKYSKKSTIKISIVSGEEKFENSYSIPVYPSQPYTIKSYIVEIPPGESLDFSSYYNDWIDKGLSSLLIVSPFRGAEILTHLKFVLEYPYGCLEQTATKLLAYSKLGKFIKFTNSKITEEDIVNTTNALIGRLITMQTLYGGFSFWPGNEKVHDWGSAYALFSLIEAKKEGYYVPDSVIRGAREYLMYYSKKSPFIYYVLSVAGVKPSLIEKYLLSIKPKKFKDFLWLALSFKNIGSNEKAIEYLKKAFEKGIDIERDYSYDFYSPLKAKALLLYAVEKILGDKESEEKILDQITAELVSKNSFYYTTQELSWSLLALSEYVRRYGGSKVSSELYLDSKKQKFFNKNGVMFYFIRKPSEYTSFLIKNSGKSKLIFTIRNSGFYKKKTAFLKESSGIDINFSILDQSKKEVEFPVVGKTYDYYVFLNSSGYYKNVAIEVPIPAGFEIENPRLKGEKFSKRGSSLITPEYVDIRDDRVIVFGVLKRGLNIYRLKVRAILSGEFLFPQISAISMYVPSVYGKSEAKRIKIH